MCDDVIDILGLHLEKPTDSACAILNII